MFSLRMLLLVVMLCAVYVAGMLFRTPWWEASILTLTYMIFAGSIAAAILLSREHRSFFVTFAAFGLAYCVSVYFRMELVTTRALDELASRVQGKVVIRDGRDDEILVKYGSGPDAQYVNPFADNPQLGTSVPVTQNADPVDDAPRRSDPSADPYFSSLRLKSIGQAFIAVLFGLVTGVIAEAIVKQKQQASSSAARASGA